MLLAISDEVISYKGVSGVWLAMTMSQVRAALGEPDSSFRKSEDSEYLTDAYDRFGMHISYRSPGICDAIELFSPATPKFQGQALLDRSFREVWDWMQGIDPSVVVDETGFTSNEFGFGVYAPLAEEAPDDPIESVIVFERGYYAV
jgi:hypothetical protein